MNKETCMKEAEESILHTYNRFPVVFDHEIGRASCRERV